MFSNKCDWDLSENAITQKKRKVGKYIDLTLSNPTQLNFSYSPVINLPVPRVHRPKSMGLKEARQSVCDYYFDRGKTISAEQTLLTSSTSEAYSYLFKLLCNARDEVIVPIPSYPLIDHLAKLEDVNVKKVAMHYFNGWHLDVEGVRDSITTKTKAILIVNPNNPCGNYLNEKDYKELVKISYEHKVALLLDEVFFDYGHGFSPVGDVEPYLLCTLSGLSKVALLPQLKLAWVVISGKKKETALKKLELIADTYLSVNQGVQEKLPHIITQLDTLQEEVKSRIKNNTTSIVKMHEDTSNWDYLPVQGGWSLIWRLPQVMSDEAWCLTLLDKGLFVQPGYFYQLNGSYVVVSTIVEEEQFKKGIKLIVGETKNR